MRYISRFKNSIRASSVYSLAFMLTFALAAGLTTYEEAAAQPSITLKVEPASIDEGVSGGTQAVTVTATASSGFLTAQEIVLTLSGTAKMRAGDDDFEAGEDYRIPSSDYESSDPDSGLVLTINQQVDDDTTPNRMGTKTLNIGLNNDGAFELPKTIVVNGALSGSIVRSATIMLIDDDYDVTLAASIGDTEVTGADNDPTISENAADAMSVMVTATLSSTRTSPTTVSLNYSGTAPSSYYTAAGTPSITIAAGLTTGTTTVTIDPNDNDTHGGAKSIIIGGSSGTLQVKPAIGFNISDNEAEPSVKLSLDPSSITEDAGGTNVRVTAELDGALLESAATVKLTVVPDDMDDQTTTSTAQSDDYTIGGSTSVTISPGSKTGTTTMVFTPEDDAYHEGDTNEIVLFQGSSDELMTVGTAMITIVDDDFDIVLELDNSMVSEDADDAVELELTARLTGGTRSTDLVVPLALATDTPAPSGYTITINDATDMDDDNITIKAGDATGTAKITVTVTEQGDDEVYSGDMKVNLVANHATLTDKLATITLVEDEAKPTITLSADPKTLVEGGTAASGITATLSGAHAQDVTVTLSFGGTAEKGEDKDYEEPQDQTISITAGQTASATSNINFNLVDDGAFENPETIIVSGTSSPSLDVSSVTLTVNDDDYDVSLAVGAGTGGDFTAGAQTVNEGADDASSVTVRATLNSARTAPLTIALSFSGDGASSQYAAISGTTTITVAPGASGATGEATVTIDPVNNELRGGNKTIMVSGTAAGVNVAAATEAITITDDEVAPTVAIKVEPARLNEDAGSAPVVVTAEITDGAALADAATIELTIDPDGDAADAGTTNSPVTMANKNDFTVSGTKSITIPAGAKSGSRTLTVNVEDDPLFEQEEMITVSAKTDAPIEGDPDSNPNTPAIADATITIVDNDFDIKLSVDTSSIAEDASDPVKVKVTATQTGSRSSDIVIAVAIAQVSNNQLHDAGDGTDGEAEITIDAGKMSGEVELSINPAAINNPTYEGERKIEITGTATGYNIQGSSIAIADDEEKPTVTLTVAPTSVTESDTASPVTVTAELKPNGLTAETTITLELGGTAVNVTDMDADGYDGRDYSATPGTITIGPGVTSVDDHIISIAHNDDDEFEATKTIIVSGKSDDVASVSSATIMLLTDDFDVALAIGTVTNGTFNRDTVEVGEAVENAGAAVVQATLQSARTTPLTIALSFSGPGAASSYSTIGGTTSITVAPGQSGATGRTTITIDPVNNMLRGGNKDINVTGTAAGINIQRPTEKITIIDDEKAPTVTITPDPARLNEDAGAAPVVVTAKLSDGAPLESAATITLKADAADVGDSNPEADARRANKKDFSISGSLEIMIPAGMEEGSTTLTVDVVDDPLFERDETITVTASTDAPVALSAGGDTPNDDEDDVRIASKMITIVDNDFDVRLSVSPASVTEGGDNTNEASDATTVTVTANLPGTRTSDVAITVAYNLGDATNEWNGATGDDKATITIKAGAMSGSTEVSISTTTLHNATYEGDRTLNVVGTSADLNVQNTSITIADDETKPTVELMASPTTVNEDTSDGRVTISWTLKPNGLTEGTTITLETSGTALRNDTMDTEGYNTRDYSATITNITVGAGAESGDNGSITITPRNDDEFEETKTIIVSGKSDAVASVSSTTINLVNDDYDVALSIPAEVGDPATDNPMVVPEDATDPVSIVVQAMLTAARTSPLTVQLTFGGTEASRYTVGGTTTITLGAGNMTSTATVTITPNDNDLRGGDKMIEVGGTATGVNVQSAEQMITLRDDEPEAALTLKADPSSIDEGAGATTVALSAELNVGMEEAATIEFKITDASTATGDGTDYTTGDIASITIPRGGKSGSSSVTITPVDDNLHEDGDETVVVMGEGGGLSGTATITINDNDYDIRLSTDVKEVAEGDEATDVVVTATLFGGVRSNALTVNLGIHDSSPTTRFTHNTGSAMDEDDAATPAVYTITASQETGAVNTLTINAGSATGTATISIDPNPDDNAFSGDKDILIVGATTDNQNVGSAKVLLRDAQRSMVTLTVDEDKIMEAGGASVDVVVTATLSEPLPAETVVTLSKGGSATKGEDYEVAGEGTITVASGETEGTTTLTITPIDDLMYEGEDGETIVVGGSASSNLRVHTASITLVDNNMIPLASFTVDPVEINEGDGATEVMITAILGGTSGEEIEIGLAKPGTAIKDEDFMVTEAEDAAAFVIAVGDTMMSKTVTITPLDDMLYEGDEIINVTGTTMIDMEAYGDPMVADITLVDNDPAPMISLAVDVDTIAEDGGPQDVTITATATSASAVDIPITLSKPGTAVIGEDFTVSSEQEDFIIVAGELTATKVVTITPIDDDIYEGDEHIMVNGTVPDPEGEADVEGTMITLTDDEMAPTVALTVDPMSISEDGGDQEVTITATASGASSMDMVIELDKSGGTALPGTDFNVTAASEGEFTITAGETMATKMVTLTPVNDDIYEGDEEIMVSGTIGESAAVSASITLTDDEMMPTVALSTDVTEVTEDGEAQDVMITATLSGLSSMDVSVKLVKDGGSAVKGEDFDVVAGEGTITVAAGDLTGTVSVTIQGIDDNLYEGNETIQIDGMANGVAASPAMVTLVDDESVPTVTLTAAPDMIEEGGGPQVGVVTATASGLSAMDMHVGLIPLLQHSTATLIGPGADVGIVELATNPNIAITIPAEQSSGSISLTIVPVDDDVYETNEYAVFAGNLMGTVSAPVTITIVDDDAPAIALSANPTTLREDGGSQSVTFDVEMSGIAVPLPTVISLGKSGTATKGTDYVPSGNAEITIPAGAMTGSTTLSFAVMDDDVYEPSNETIVVTASWEADHHGTHDLDSVTLTIVDNYAAPAVTTAIPDMVLEAGDSRQADVSGSFSGKALTYSASSSGSEVSADVTGSSLSITANRKGAASVTVTASNAAGTASFEIGVTVTAIAAERMVYTDILAAMGRGIMSSVSNTIGGRFSVTAAERQIALANRRVDGMAAGMEAMISLTGAQETRKYGITDDTIQRSDRQPVTTRDLMRGTSFYYALDDAPQGGMNGGLSFTIWGAGDWNAFEGSPSVTSSYDGTLTAGYLGVDVSKTASWIAGVAVGRTMGTADYDVSVTDGTLEATLNSVYPYVHWTGPGCCIEVWGIGGFGTGEAEVSDGTSDLSMSLGMLGVRAQLVGSATGGLDLDLIGDAGITKLSTADSESASLSDLEASVQRVRVGLEASRTSDMGNGMLVTPFAQLAGRYDGGDGQTGNGLEVAGGLRIAGGRAGLEARGRFLAMHTGEEVKEHGVSVVAYVRPMGAGGQGLSMSIAPRIGADTDMSGGIWREDPMNDVTRSSRSGAGVKAEIGYGLTTPMLSNILVTPFGTMDMAGEDQRRMRLGARFGSIGDTTSILSFEFTGERIDGNGRTPDHRIGLLGRMSF